MSLIQLVINILSQAGLFAVIGTAFYLIYSTSRIFHISLGGSLTLSAYISYSLYVLNINIYICVLVAVLTVVVLELSICKFIYLKLKKKQSASYIFLFVSLGIYIIFQNIISIIWGDGSYSFNIFNKQTINFWGITYIKSQLFLTVASLFLSLTMFFLLSKSKFGRKLKAVSSNLELSTSFGINIHSIFIFSFLISAILISTIGVLIALDTDFVPTIGFNLVIYGIVILIIGGLEYKSILIGALLLSSIQNITVYYFGNLWQDAIIYTLLIVLLVLKPHGLSSIQIKKVNI